MLARKRADAELLRCARIIEIYERNAQLTNDTDSPAESQICIWMLNAQCACVLQCCSAACERCVFFSAYFVCALLPIQQNLYPSVRTPIRMHFRSPRWFSVYEFYLKMVLINGYLFLSIMELWFRQSPCPPLSNRPMHMQQQYNLRHSVLMHHTRAHSTLGTISFR